MADAHQQRTAPTTATPLNSTSGLSTTATPPRAGPRTTPVMAEAIAEPISLPRPPEDSTISQLNTPVQLNAPPTPCTKRAASSRAMCWPNPKASPEMLIRMRPVIVVCLGPYLAANHPPGNDPGSVPAA